MRAAAVRGIKYPPRGTRGLANSRAADFGQRRSLGDYIRFANEQTLVVTQVKTAESVESLPEILQVGGVDVIFVGLADLSNSLGVPGQMDHQKRQQMLDRIVDLVVGSDKVLATMAVGADATNRWLERGPRYVTTTCDALAKSGAQSYLGAVRDH